LVDELRPDAMLGTPKSHVTEHTISIEPVSIPAEVFVGHQIASIPNILPAVELPGYGTSVCTRREGEDLVYR
jgi:hypothetical protein